MTGIIATIALLLIIATSILKRKHRFEVFAYTHQLYFVYFFALMYHSTLCFVKTNNGKCDRMIWYFSPIPFVLVMMERIFALVIPFREKAQMEAIFVHPKNVIGKSHWND